MLADLKQRDENARFGHVTGIIHDVGNDFGAVFHDQLELREESIIGEFGDEEGATGDDRVCRGVDLQQEHG